MTASASLNWKEIDLLLEELSLAGSLVQDVHQPTHDKLVFSLFRSGEHFTLLVSLSTRFPRLHLLTEKLPNPPKPYRFAAFLRAHIKGGKIESAGQVGRERIVRIDMKKADERKTLWLRLWGSAANAIVTDADGVILDAFYRRPKRGEVSGGKFEPPAARPIEAQREYGVRELPGEGGFNARVENFFRKLEASGDAENTRARLETELSVRESKVLANLEKLEKRLAEYSNLERFKELGDLLISSLHRISKGDRWVKVEDFFHGDVPVDIELSPELTPPQNAESYYERYRKARDGMGKVVDEIAHLRGMLDAIERDRSALSRGDVETLRAQEGKAEQRRKTAVSPDTPGLVFERPPYRLIVGRSGRENDELLRHAVRGNDWWFHSRDYPGAYVFVKAPQGKSLPLEVMLDAGNLAIHFSKGKNSGVGDVYYTRVKYLRRAKGGKRGLVIPTQEKNLHVRLDEARIERLKSGGE